MVDKFYREPPLKSACPHATRDASRIIHGGSEFVHYSEITAHEASYLRVRRAVDGNAVCPNGRLVTPHTCNGPTHSTPFHGQAFRPVGSTVDTSDELSSDYRDLSTQR